MHEAAIIMRAWLAVPLIAGAIALIANTLRILPSSATAISTMTQETTEHGAASYNCPWNRFRHCTTDCVVRARHTMPHIVGAISFVAYALSASPASAMSVAMLPKATNPKATTDHSVLVIPSSCGCFRRQLAAGESSCVRCCHCRGRGRRRCVRLLRCRYRGRRLGQRIGG